MDLYESYVEPAVSFVTGYKWTCLIAALGVWYVWTLVSPAYYKWKREKEEKEWEAYLHRDPDAVVRRQEAMLAARMRLQQEHDAKAELHAEKMKEKEEQNRASVVSDWDRHREGKGYRSKAKPSAAQEAFADRAASELTSGVSNARNGSSGDRPTAPRRLRPEFNPLSGQGNVCRFTPTPRGGSGGG